MTYLTTRSRRLRLSIYVISRVRHRGDRNQSRTGRCSSASRHHHRLRLGMSSASRRLAARRFGRFGHAAALFFVGAFPYFWLATLALYFLGFQWDLFPLRHAYSDGLSPAYDVRVRPQRRRIT